MRNVVTGVLLGRNMSFPVVHSHAFAHGPLPQLRRRPAVHVQASCSQQRPTSPQQGLSCCAALRGEHVSCRQLPSRTDRTRLHAVARQGGDNKREEPSDGFQERVVQVRRVTKVVKGGKQLSFRCKLKTTVLCTSVFVSDLICCCERAAPCKQNFRGRYAHLQGCCCGWR